MKSRTLIIFPILTSLLVVSCKKEEPEPQTNWEKVKHNAQETVDAAMDLSEEKWESLKAFGKKEWDEAGSRLSDLKDQAEQKGEELKPKVEELLAEVEELRGEVSEKAGALVESSDEKLEQAEKQLKESWEKLKEKIGELESSLSSD